MRSLAVSLLLAAWMATAQAAEWSVLSGKTVGVLDGDTIDVLTPERELHRVRISGIDAPEKKQPFGQRAKARLSGLAFGRQVDIEWHKRDRYGRIVGKVLLPDGRDAGLVMVADGLAWWYRKYAREQRDDQDRERYSDAEASARKKKLGLWADPEPVPPWEFRHRRRD